MAREGRSARTRQQRLARRRQETRGYDEGGGRKPFYRQTWFKPVVAIGVIGIIAGLVGGSLPLITGGGGGAGPGGADAVDPIVRRDPADPNAGIDIGAVEKPQFDAAPALALTPGTDYRAVLELESGEVEIDLFEDLAPVHVNNFVFLAEQGFFDGLTFHRVIESFVVQGGDPTATGTGGAGYVLPDESAGPGGALSLGGDGVIAMARSGAGASSSQFFITLAPQAQLDELDFTAFGVVTAGLDLVLAIPLRDPQQVPPPPPGARIVAIRIEQGAAPSGDTAGDTADDTADEQAVE